MEKGYWENGVSRMSKSSADISAIGDDEPTSLAELFPGRFPAARPSGQGGRHARTASLTLLVDDRTFIRECIARCLRSASEHDEVLAFADIEACVGADIASERVGCILFHTHHRRASDPEIERGMAQLLERFPGAPIILMSDGDGADRILEALERGARGYIPTDAPVDVAVGATRLVSAGGTFIPASSLMAVTSANYGREVTPTARQFTQRQLAVLQRLRQGKANRTIARELAMSEGTVKAHVRNIMQKLKATNRTQVVFLTRDLFPGDRG